MTARIRVLVVDDSAFARKVLRDILSSSTEIEVVGIARDGLEALEKASELRPDVMTLDLVMPNLDGIGVLESLPQDGPRVLLVSNSDAESELALSALELGAIDLVSKPTALATDRLYELRAELLRKIKIVASAVRPRRSATPVAPTRAAPRAITGRLHSLVVIGTSTGGPQALTRLLAALPGDFPVPIAVALHIPAGYTEALARRLNETCALEVVEAEDGVMLLPGRAVIARGGSHLTVHATPDGQLRGAISHLPSDTLHFPSVNVLFESAVVARRGGVVGVVLTGMGNDGTRGAGAIRRAGGLVLTESAGSCVVYGMPRSVVEAGDSDGEATLGNMPELLLARL